MESIKAQVSVAECQRKVSKESGRKGCIDYRETEFPFI